MNQVVIGSGVGVVFALTVVLLLAYIRRNPSKAHQILKSAMCLI